MSCCCVFLETLRTLNMQSLTHAKKEWVTKLVDSMFLLERGKGVPEMINRCSIMSASFMATWFQIARIVNVRASRLLS